MEEQTIDTQALGEKIVKVLKSIYDPEIPVDIYELGLIYDVFVNEDCNVKILMTLTTPNCPVAETLPVEVEDKVKSLKMVNDAEVEITFDVDPETEVPDWTQVPLVVTVAEPEVRELDAVYYDTAEYVLGRAGYALRRREGGPDAGWHLKGPRQGSGRMETGWPLDIGGDTASVTGVPPEIAAHIGDLTTDPLVVIARNSSFAYKGQSPDIRRVCCELGVRYVLKGSVRRAGNRVRINAQLINGDDGGHISAERYDRDLEDIFAVQDEVTREIVSALQVELTPVEISRRALLGKVNPEAYDCIYRARNSLWQFSRESMAESHAMCVRAIEIDPNIAAPYAIRSVVICTEFANGWNNVGAHDLDQALSQAQQACDLDDQDPNCHSSMAFCRIWRRELEEALRSAERAIELDPNYAHGYSALAMVLDYMGQHARAVDIFQKSLLRDPHHDMMLHLQGRAQMALGQYDLAEANLKLRISRNPGTDTTRAYLAALYGLLGRIDEAREVWRQLLEINPNFYYSLGLLRDILDYENHFVRNFWLLSICCTLLVEYSVA